MCLGASAHSCALFERRDSSGTHWRLNGEPTARPAASTVVAAAKTLLNSWKADSGARPSLDRAETAPFSHVACGNRTISACGVRKPRCFLTWCAETAPRAGAPGTRQAELRAWLAGLGYRSGRGRQKMTTPAGLRVA